MYLKSELKMIMKGSSGKHINVGSGYIKLSNETHFFYGDNLSISISKNSDLGLTFDTPTHPNFSKWVYVYSYPYGGI